MAEKMEWSFHIILQKEDLLLLVEWLYGIDTSAHIGALKAKGRTIAVLGTGFNNIYPPENIQLFEDILNNNGTIVTEYEPDTKKVPNNFRRRNRIVSGLSIGVLVIEAAYRSGTGITVDYARRQKKPIFGLPSSIENKKGVGTNRLLKRDGILVTDTNDILEFFKLRKTKQIGIEEIEQIDRLEIKDEYKEIYKIIENGNTNINQIRKISNLNISELSSKLLMMELEGLIETKPGSNYEIKI